MARKTYPEEKILSVLKEVADGATIGATCRKHGIAEPTFYRWREKYQGMEKSDLTRLRALEVENARLKRLLADAPLDREIQKEALSKLGKL